MADNWTGPPAVTPRWGQLTYASFDPDNGAGGWQVMSTAGELSDGEIESLRQRIVTRFDSDTPLGAFPNAAELEAMPRRLTYICDGRGQGAYWHSTMAGRDATGRPGNVFSHVLLDRATAQPTPAIRPIEIWRSPGLLCPFGPEQVREAVLREDAIPSFGASLGRQDVLDFLFDQTEWRVGLTQCPAGRSVGRAERRPWRGPDYRLCGVRRLVDRGGEQAGARRTGSGK